MAERFSFNDPDFTQAYLKNWHKEDARKEAERASQEAYTEAKMQLIHELAEMYSELGLVKNPNRPSSQSEIDEAELERRAQLILDSNTFDFIHQDFFRKMHQDRQARFGDARGNHFATEIQHERQYKPGWGWYGNQTQDEVREQSYHPAALKYAEQRLIIALENGSLEQLELF